MYSDEEVEAFENDKRLVYFFLNKFLIKSPDLQNVKNDLFSDCMLLLVKRKKDFDEKKGSYANFVLLIVKSAFYCYIRARKTDKHKLSLNDNVSLDDIVHGTDDVLFVDSISDNTDLDCNVNYEFVKFCFDEAIKDRREKFKTICNDIINEIPTCEIMEKYGVSRQYVNQIKFQLRDLMYKQLKKYNYNSPYIENYKLNKH